MTTAPLRLFTERDREILAALDLVPLTVPQLLKLSETFGQPFTSERRVRERLQQLAETGWVLRWPYATAGPGAPLYYKPSRMGFALLHGEHARAPTKRAFGPVGLLKQAHTIALAAFMVQTCVAAHRLGYRVTNVYRENTFKLQTGAGTVYPDDSFQIRASHDTAYNFFLEIDCSTERIRSTKDAESWERKLRTYDRWQNQSTERARVLIVAVRDSDRIAHILETAAQITENPRRSLFYGVSLSAYLAAAEPLTAACFRDHRGNQVALIPRPMPTDA
jgi:hypothetical protein